MHRDFARLFASVPMLVCCFCVLRLLLPFPVPEAAALPLAYALDFLSVSVVTYLSLVTIVRWVCQLKRPVLPPRFLYFCRNQIRK